MAVHIIHTGRDGALEDTTTVDIDSMLLDPAASERLVVYLHGGLVSEDSARETASRLAPELAEVTYPIFFVYESGLLEILRNNLHEISKERLFKKIVKKLLKYAVGKLGDAAGARSSDVLSVPLEIEITREFNRSSAGFEPYADLVVADAEEIEDISTTQERQIIEDLSGDSVLQEMLQEIVNGATPENEVTEEGAKGVVTLQRTSSETLLSPDVVAELVLESGEKDGKGLLSTAKFFKKLAKILFRVVQRYRKKRHHGLYATVVEETLRELYIANVGAWVWEQMKKDTADTFDEVGGTPIRGGWYFVRKLGELMASGTRPEVSIVAHSLGSVFASNLIEHLDAARRSPAHPLPADFEIANLLLMAPAVEFRRLARTLREQGDLIRNFRMFNLSDELEKGYWEVPVIYPRSLLYLVSGVVEKQDDGSSAYDRPLVGMQRYYDMTDVYDDPDIEALRLFVGSNPSRVVWSEEDRGPGEATDAIRHGGFDDLGPRRKTIDSLKEILQS